ncbi:MAG: tetratricopeptide repeat protein [Desulfovibrionaceae bacterium]|nr:tetratricopeptide repeat protein [Desulfovibrionaceae bacterium]
MTSFANLSLSRGDLMEMEGQLCQSMAAFVSFDGHALYFPTGEAPEQPEFLSRERRLLLPLVWQEQFLGMLMLHNVRAREVRPLLPFLPALGALCLENLARVRAAGLDSVTGLATEAVLYSQMEDAAARVRAHLDDPARPDDRPAPLHRLCMGLVLIRLRNGDDIVREHGYAFEEDMLRRLAQACREGLASDVLAARVGRHELALLLAVSGRGACHKQAKAALERMAAVRLPGVLTDRMVRPRLCAGHAVYPQDMQGSELRLPMFEQARQLMARARLAADVVGQDSVSENRTMPFARILQDGGVVLESLSLGRVRTSLGKQCKAQENLRFAVWGGAAGAPPCYKGELTLLHVRENDSIGEMLYVHDATLTPEPGDRLALLDTMPALDLVDLFDPLDSRDSPELPGAGEQRGDVPGREAVPSIADGLLPQAEEQREGLCDHGEFLARYAREREQSPRFVLGIVRLSAGTPVEDDKARDMLASLWQSGELCLSSVQPAPLAGRYGCNGLIVFHADAEAEALLPAYAALARAARQKGLDLAVGLAGYPFLQYRKAEMQDCALKALEYALLLPDVHVGQCNSLALNISADRRYSLGDVFGAMEEYKQALLADADNVMAWNSLGVCMAALGRQHEARRHFLEALKRKPDTPMTAQICYNLGTVCQHLDERRAAARYYRRCSALVPEHLFAQIRLGQLCEQGGRRREARACYERAAAIEDARADGSSLARRHLARVAVRQRRGREARELLHEALLRNPGDAASMLLLANIYLDSKEDPAVAELLARKSANLHDRPEAWQTLARALRGLGRDEEARLAEARAVLG